MALINADRLDTSPVEYVVEEMLPDFGVGWAYGTSYTGKSLVLGVELCLAIANGIPFFGKQVVQGSVAWCLGEGLADAGVRLKARRIREQADRRTRADEIAGQLGPEAAQAWLAAQPPYTDSRVFVRTNAFQVPFTAGNEPTAELRQAAAELSLIDDLRLVILDTGQNFSSLSLTNDTSANRFMLGMSHLAGQLGCTVLAIAHPVSKGGGKVGLPGNRLFGASDFVWRFQAGEDSTEEAPNALIIAEKVKSGALFRPLAYELERIAWHQPPVDPDTGDEIPDIPLVRVSSVTIRQRQDEQADLAGPALPDLQPRAPRPLPEAETVPPSRPRRRTGVLPASTFRAVRPAAPAAPAADQDPDAAGRAALVAALISVPCPVGSCLAHPGESCAPSPAGSGIDYIILDQRPLVLAHIERVGAVITEGRADMKDVVAQFHAGNAPAELATAPA